MKYVYILVSNEYDIYYEQTLLSIFSLKLKNKHSDITLICDDSTALNLSDSRSAILKYITDLISINFEKSYSNLQRSRYLKTKMRDLVKGDFLYIDSDTIIIEDLSDSKSFSGDISAVIDKHFKLINHPMKETFYLNATRLGFDKYTNGKYFNGGVLCVKDTQCSHDFFREWHDLWKYSCSKNIFIDMPSLAEANFRHNYLIQEIDGSWNCQIENGMRFLSNAKIIHSFATAMAHSKYKKRPYHFMNKEVYLQIRNENCINKNIISSIENAKSAFYIDTEIISGEMLDLKNSALYTLLFSLYTNHPQIFKMLNSIPSKIKVKTAKFRNKNK